MFFLQYGNHDCSMCEASNVKNVKQKICRTIQSILPNTRLYSHKHLVRSARIYYSASDIIIGKRQITSFCKITNVAQLLAKGKMISFGKVTSGKSRFHFAYDFKINLTVQPSSWIILQQSICLITIFSYQIIMGNEKTLKQLNRQRSTVKHKLTNFIYFVYQCY